MGATFMSSPILGGRYRVLSHLGGGGFGQTFLAEDRHLPGQPRCVVKQLQPRVADAVSLESARRLFDAEAQALYQLGGHDQIPRLLAHFEEGTQFYLVQEYVEGTLLTEEIYPGCQQSEAEVIALLRDVLETLAFVHQHQVIHRDIKPSNLIRRQRDGKVVLIDFGSVKQVSRQPIEEYGQVSITVAIGSLGYMPNEQLAGQPCLSSDIYAVGILALQALTGLEPKRLPKDPRTSEIMWRELAPVSDGLADMLDRMVRYDFRQRHPDAMEAFDELMMLISPPRSAPAEIAPALESDAIATETHQMWLERADELFQQNRFDEAARCYEQVVQGDPQCVTAWFKLGMVYEHLNRNDAAIQAYDQVIQQQPEDYLAWLKRAKVLEQMERYEGALAAYEEVLRLQPDNYWAWNDRGYVLEQSGQVDAAIAAYGRAVQLKPDFQLALENRKRLLVALKRVEDLYTLQHYSDAIAACDRALEGTPDDANLWLMRGMALENLARLPEAAIAYNHVIRLQPRDHVTWFKLGTVLEALKRPGQAARAYGQVVRLQPRNHWAWQQRAKMLEQMDQPREAIAAYQKVLQIQPDFEPARTAYQRLLNRTLSTATAS